LDSEPGIQILGIVWELTIDPRPIVSGEVFAAELRGTMAFNEKFLNSGQLLFEGGFKELMSVDAQATVHVRSGATGDDVVLKAERIPSTCFVGGNECDPDNDLPSVPGLRGNTDCEPQADINPCVGLVEVPTSEDCAPGGLCDDLGWTGQCALNGFCVSGPVERALAGGLGSYRADASGNVLFGFDAQNTSAELLEEGGCNDGTWVMPVPRFEDPVGPNGTRVIIGGVPMAHEFVMGVESRGPFGIGSCDPLASPTPDSILISFPIQTP